MSVPWTVAAEVSLKLDLPARAQVEATLALVEQQRIANLIAYLSAHVIGGGAGSNGAIEDIERALGLT